MITPDNPKVELSPSGCWLWIGYCFKNGGYASVNREGKVQLGHRYNWKKKNGEVPEGLELHHTCNTTNCINPDHLKAITHQENVRDYSDTKISCPRGHPYTVALKDKYGYRSRRCYPCENERRRARERVKRGLTAP